MAITELDSLTALDIKEQNVFFLDHRDHEYFHEAGTYERTRQRVMSTRNGDLRRILRSFPTDAPLIEQGAWWMRALVGKHFFPDANHRTAMVTFRYLMDENGIDPPDLDIDMVERTTADSKAARLRVVEVTFGSLNERDELFYVWCAYFAETL